MPIYNNGEHPHLEKKKKRKQRVIKEKSVEEDDNQQHVEVLKQKKGKRKRKVEEEDSQDETSRRRKKKKLKDEQILEEFEERDVGKVQSKQKESLELDKTYPNKGLEFDDRKREKKKKKSKKKEKYSGSKSESKENDDSSICVEEDNRDETSRRKKKKKLKDEQILEEFEERDVGVVQRKRIESLELDKTYLKNGLEFDDPKRKKKTKKSKKKEKYSVSKSESKENDDISICVEEDNRDETSRRRKKKKLKYEQILEEFEERDVGKVKRKQKESLELDKTYLKNGLEFDEHKRKKKKKKSKKKEKYSGSKSESKENDDILICVEEDNWDETSIRRKKKKIKDQKNLDEFGERGVGKVQRKQKESLESENDYRQKKKKSNMQEKIAASKTESKENDNASICHEKSFKKKPKRKRKEKKLKNIEATEKEQLPKLPVAEKIKSKKVDKEHSKPGTKRGEDFECDAIHCHWFSSEEIKERCQLRQGKWAKSEEKILTENMKIYLSENNLDDPSKLIFAYKHNDQSDEAREWKEFSVTTNFYRKLGKGINRTLLYIYRKVLRNFDEQNHEGRFSESEDKELERLLALHGKKWEKIGRMMKRSGMAAHRRYSWITGDRGKWKDSEVHLLKEAVRKVSNTREGEEAFTNINWKAVASIVKTRNSLQCRQKWIYSVCWKECKLSTWRKWGEVEELQLIKKVYESSVTEGVDIDWHELQKDFDMARSPSFLRAKFNIILKKYCNFTYLENTDFEDIIDYLYNVKSKELQDKCLGDQETNLE